MRVIKLFFIIGIIAEQLTIDLIRNRLLEIYENNLSTEEFTDALTKTISKIMNFKQFKFENLQDLVDNFRGDPIEVEKIMSIFEEKFEQKSLEKVFTEIFTSELNNFLCDKSLHSDKLLEAYEYFIYKNLYMIYHEFRPLMIEFENDNDNIIANETAKKIIENAIDTINSKIYSTFLTFHENMINKITILNKNIENNEAIIVTDIYVNQVKDYKKFIDSSDQKIIKVVETLIKKADESIIEEKGDEYRNRILYFAENLIDLCNQKSLEWIPSIKNFINNLKELLENDSKASNDFYRDWNLEIQAKLSNLLPYDENVNINKNDIDKQLNKNLSDDDQDADKNIIIDSPIVKESDKLDSQNQLDALSNKDENPVDGESDKFDSQNQLDALSNKDENPVDGESDKLAIQSQIDAPKDKIEDLQLFSENENPSLNIVQEQDNIAYNVYGDIGEKNLEIVRKTHGSSNFKIETKYIPYDEDTEIELTIVYVDTVESPCYGENGSFK